MTTLGDVVPIPATVDVPESRVVGILHIVGDEDSLEEEPKRCEDTTKLTNSSRKCYLTD